MSVLGRIRKTTKFGNKAATAPALSAGTPNSYNLDFFLTDSYLGVPFYHFMSNWETAGSKINFTKRGGGPAKVGHRVEAWSNTFLGPGEGDAVVAKDHNGENYFGTNGYPTLVEKDYSGKKLKGLRFTGTEYLQINGATVADTYGVDEYMFSTGGTTWAGKTGATFIFVLDQDPINDTTVNPLANGIQSLLISRQPVTTAIIPTPIPPAYSWPETEYFGVQYFRAASTPHETWQNEQRWGPDATDSNVFGIPILKAANPTVSPTSFRWGGAARWVPEPGGNIKTNEGLQVILLEYDNTDHFKYDACSTPQGWDRDYFGPRVKIWGMSTPAPSFPIGTTPWWQGGWGCEVPPSNSLYCHHTGGPLGHGAWEGPQLISLSPALRDWALFHDKNAFLGGTPPVRSSSLNNEYGNGFRGILYEVLMLEGILSLSDKARLKKILKRKYPLN